MEYGCSVIVNSTPVVTARSQEHLWHSISLAGYSGGGMASSGAKVTPKTAMGYPPLYRAINLISGSVAGLPFDVFRRQRGGGKKVDNRHPAQTLLERKANEYMHAYTFRRTMTALALLHGNAYASIDRIEGRPVAMAIWNPQNTIVRVVDGELYYITYVDGDTIRVPGRDMLHIRGLGPDGICGYPLIDLMADALGVGMAAMQFGARFFGQGSNMSGLLMIPGHFSEEKIRNTMAAWNSMQSGLSNAHKVALLQDGVKFQQLTVDPDKAQFLQTREHEVRATVANITGVPPHMLGDSTRTSHNSLESEGQSYLDYTLQPWLKTWEAECEDKLLSEQQRQQDTHIIEFNREALVQMSFMDKVMGIAKQQETGILNVNEARALLNLPEIGADGEKRFHPANWMEIGAEQEMEDEEKDDSPDQTEVVLNKLITSTVTKAFDMETDRAIRMANRRATEFVQAVDEFYQTWTDNTLSGLDDSSVRNVIASHAEESKRALLDVAGNSTMETLKQNVTELVCTWDSRRDSLIQSILHAVAK